MQGCLHRSSHHVVQLTAHCPSCVANLCKTIQHAYVRMYILSKKKHTQNTIHANMMFARLCVHDHK